MKFISFFPQLNSITNDVSATLFLSYIYVKAQYCSHDTLLIRKYAKKCEASKSWEEDLGLSTKVMTRIFKTYSSKLTETVYIPETFHSMPQYYIPRLKNIICRMRDSRTRETVFEIAREEFVQYIDNCINTASKTLKQPKTLFIDNGYWCGHISELKDKLIYLLNNKYTLFNKEQSKSIIDLLLLEQKNFRECGEYINNTSGAIMYTQVFSYIENRICKLPKQIAFDLTWITLENVFGETNIRPSDSKEYHKLFMSSQRIVKIVKAQNTKKYIQYILKHGYTFFDFFKENIAKEFVKTIL